MANKHKRLLQFIILSLIVFAVFSGVLVAAAQDDRRPLPPSFPKITIRATEETAPGVLYLANLRRTDTDDETTRPYLIILNNDGTPAFFRPAPMPPAYNFGRMPNGNRYVYSLLDRGLGRGAAMDGIYHILDSQGNIIRDITIIGEGLPTQMHAFVPLENGNVLLTSQPTHTEDLTAFGGDAEAIVVETIIQEIDPDDNVVFEWSSADHVELTETRTPRELMFAPPAPVAYFHGNGLAVDQNGDIIISARRFDELIKINRQTGDIIWRMGGPASQNNEFTFINDPRGGFSGQHHVTVLPNGNILLFDNGDLSEERVSRAVEYEIDEESRTATLVWSFEDPAGRYTGSMGSAQRLSNGNTLIGWGNAPPEGPNAIEVNSDGEIVFELWLPPSQMTYRIYRYEE